MKRSAGLLLRKELWTQRLIAACPHGFHPREIRTRLAARNRRAAQRYSFDTKRVPRKVPLSARSGPGRLAGRPGRRCRFSPASSSLRPSERKKQSVRLDGLTSAASRPPPPHGRARIGAGPSARADAEPLARLLKRSASPLLRKKSWTQRSGATCPRKFHLRKMTTRHTARLRKACAAVLF